MVRGKACPRIDENDPHRERKREADSRSGGEHITTYASGAERESEGGEYDPTDGHTGITGTAAIADDGLDTFSVLDADGSGVGVSSRR